MKKTVVALSMLVLAACGTGYDAGNGKKIGQVIQIGKHGLVCGTYEGILARGGLNGGSGAVGQSMEFSVVDQAVYERLVKAMESQQEIEATYSLRGFVGACTAETAKIITDFRVLQETVKPVDEKGRKIQELQEQLQELQGK